MIQRLAGSLALLALLAPASAPAADVHTIFTSWTSWYGRESTVRIESWLGADRECRLQPSETRIVRRDLGVMWRFQPSGDTYNEYPLKAEPGPARAGRPVPPEAQPASPEDLRFVGHFEEPVYDWTTRPLGEEIVQGEACKVFELRGDADFAIVRAKLWISPEGRSRGLAAPDDLLAAATMRGRGGVIEAIIKVLAAYPNGGLVGLDMTADPPIGPESRAKIELVLYEKADAPAGIYDVPAGRRKDPGKRS